MKTIIKETTRLRGGYISTPMLNKNKHGNWELTFESPINLENGYTNTPLGTYTSVMELFLHDGWTLAEGSATIEWTIESLDKVEHIGLWWDNGELVGYDGVFELPSEVKQLLEVIGVTIPDDSFV